MSGNFQFLSFEEIQKAALELKGQYAKVESAEEMFGVRAARDSKSGLSCSPLIIRVSHIGSLDSDQQRPQVFISGEIHGDEKIGPISSLFTAQLLVWSASCEIDKDENSCKLLREIAVSKDQRVWLTHLATRRDTFIIPTTNCLGYITEQRSDAGDVDPNRDFAYVRQDTKCLQSVTANIIVELFRSNIVQSVVTFHGTYPHTAYLLVLMNMCYRGPSVDRL